MENGEEVNRWYNFDTSEPVQKSSRHHQNSNKRRYWKKDRFQGQTCQPRRNPETNWDSYSTKQFSCLSPGNEAMTLPETNSSPLKIDPWKRRFLLESTIFRGYVSFRECKKCRFQCWGSQTTCTELINPECFFGRVILYTDTCHVLLWFAAIPRGWDMAVSFQNSFWRNATLKVSWSMYTVDIYIYSIQVVAGWAWVRSFRAKVPVNLRWAWPYPWHRFSVFRMSA